MIKVLTGNCVLMAQISIKSVHVITNMKYMYYIYI